MGVKAEIARQASVTTGERDGMFAVFARYYDNVERSRFMADLSAKDWVILISGGDGGVAGFSSLQLYEHSGSAGSAMIIYSGDTIVDRVYRQNSELAGAFGHFLRRVIRQYPGKPLYWLLTSKGVRTYRFLPVFFHVFFPAHDHDVEPDVKLLLDEVAAARFGEAYSPVSRVVAHKGLRDRLCAAEHDPLLLERADPHVRFFLRMNPGYVQGDELACIAPVSEENLNARARRVIRCTEVCWRE